MSRSVKHIPDNYQQLRQRWLDGELSSHELASLPKDLQQTDPSIDLLQQQLSPAQDPNTANERIALIMDELPDHSFERSYPLGWLDLSLIACGLLLSGGLGGLGVGQGQWTPTLTASLLCCFAACIAALLGARKLNPSRPNYDRKVSWRLRPALVVRTAVILLLLGGLGGVLANLGG